jgi:hypothetical protein
MYHIIFQIIIVLNDLYIMILKLLVIFVFYNWKINRKFSYIFEIFF